MRSLEMGRSSTLLRNTHNNSALSFSSPMDRPRMYGTATTLAKEERNTMTRWGAAAVVGGVLLAGAMSKQKVSAEEFFDFSPGSGEGPLSFITCVYLDKQFFNLFLQKCITEWITFMSMRNMTKQLSSSKS